MSYIDEEGRIIKRLDDDTILRVSKCKKEYTELDIFKAETFLELEFLKSILELRGIL